MQYWYFNTFSLQKNLNNFIKLWPVSLERNLEGLWFLVSCCSWPPRLILKISLQFIYGLGYLGSNYICFWSTLSRSPPPLLSPYSTSAPYAYWCVEGLVLPHSLDWGGERDQLWQELVSSESFLCVCRCSVAVCLLRDNQAALKLKKAEQKEMQVTLWNHFWQNFYIKTQWFVGQIILLNLL